MTKYIVQRILWIFVILVTTLTITYVLLKLAPEYPPQKNEEMDTWLEKQVEDGYYTSLYLYTSDPEDMAQLDTIRRTEKNLNKSVFIVVPIGSSEVFKVFYRVPIATQYFNWLKNVVTEWNWGTSTKIRANAPAFSLISEKIPLTMTLNLSTLFFYIPFGFAFGILAALKKDTWVDNLMQVVVMVFLSVPSLVLVLILVVVFGYQLNWLPTLFPLVGIETTAELAKGFIIPVLAMSLPSIAGFTRLLRAELSEVLTSDFVMLAKTKGLSHRQSVLRHAIRNSLVPMVPVIIGSFATLLSGSYVMESVYAIPGVGKVSLQALTTGNYDYNVLMVSNAFYGIIGLFTVLIVDLSYGIVDPRIRMGAKK